MGDRTKYARKGGRETALKREIWKFIEKEMGQELDIGASNEVVSRICEAIGFVVEDMRNVGELNRAGKARRHWYNLQLEIGEDKLSMQNTLEEAQTLPPHPPTRAQLWLRTLISILIMRRNNSLFQWTD